MAIVNMRTEKHFTLFLDEKEAIPLKAFLQNPSKATPKDVLNTVEHIYEQLNNHFVVEAEIEE